MTTDTILAAVTTGDGETNLNSTQLFSCKVKQSSLYTDYFFLQFGSGVWRHMEPPIEVRLNYFVVSVP